ncbi:hypothetical protein DUNSADRAFT_10497, partial [Dunaliella salina]
MTLIEAVQQTHANAGACNVCAAAAAGPPGGGAGHAAGHAADSTHRRQSAPGRCSGGTAPNRRRWVGSAAGARAACAARTGAWG